MTTQLELQHFAVLDLTYTHFEPDLYICVKTNNPCHLTCYYTDIVPVRHATSRVVRGLALPWGAYWCFVAWKTVEQQEAGDTIYHKFHFPEWYKCALIPPPWTDDFKMSLTRFYEPWGTHLLENNTWFIIADPEPPEITFANSIITLDFTGTSHSGIQILATNGDFPLEAADGSPCYIYTIVTEIISRSYWDAIVHGFYCKSADEDILLYLTHTIHGGTLFPTEKGYTIEAGKHVGWQYIEPGLNKSNLLELWKDTRAHFGLSTDPTNWFISQFEIAHKDLIPVLPSILKSDTLAIYYPPPKKQIGRWFTFRGTVNDELSPSVTALMEHCHPGGYPRDIILRPNAPGDICNIPYQVGDPCPNHYLNVNEAIPDEDTTYLLNGWPWTQTYKQDLYNIPYIDQSLAPIDQVGITARCRRRGGFAYASKFRVLLKTHGIIYKTPLISHLSIFWANFTFTWPTNPNTGQPWTCQEVNDLQIGIELYYYHHVGDDTYTICTQLYTTITRSILCP